MTEYLHILVALWVGGTTTVHVSDYDECWRLADVVSVVPAPEGAGDLLGVQCIRTDVLTAVPVPELRP